MQSFVAEGCYIGVSGRIESRPGVTIPSLFILYTFKGARMVIATIELHVRRARAQARK